MCTVSVVPFETGFRLMCNRDERTTRSADLPPRSSACGAHVAWMPIDPDSGGTWLGASDAGIVLALVNRNASRSVGEHATRRLPAVGTCVQRSRGLVIPSLLHESSLEAMLCRLRAMDLSPYQPFRLLIASRAMVGIVTHDADGLGIERRALDAPVFVTSSSLGDHLAEAYRRPLFERLVIHAPDSPLAGQRRFHHHRSRHLAAFSVVMSRPTARTVSRSAVTFERDRLTFSYEPLPSLSDRAAGRATAAIGDGAQLQPQCRPTNLTC